MRCLILAAGLGTRLGSLTAHTPKPMIEVGGKPVLAYIVEGLKKHGITEIIVNVHYKHEKIMQYFGKDVLYFYEPKLLGEEGTIKALTPWLGPDPFFVCNGDTITNVNYTEMMNLCRQYPYTYFMKDDRYAGTKIINPKEAGNKFIYPYRPFNAYYFDTNTIEKLEKAKEYFK